jgi:long-chain acyl-CoA synthetase
MGAGKGANGANGHATRLDVAATFAGKRILLIGTTGFVGKVALSMLLDRYPGVATIYCLVRPGAGNTADERFYKKVASSEAFRPLREKYGDGLTRFLESKIVAIPGDIGRPLCNFSDEQFAQFEAAGGLDVILNSAGLVSFMPSLESALRINALGAKNVLDAARRAKCRLVHVSTCYVAGQRDGEVWEDEPVVGYFPRRDQLRDKDFDASAEIADCQRIVDQVRDQPTTGPSPSSRGGGRSLRDQRRDPETRPCSSWRSPASARSGWRPSSPGWAWSAPCTGAGPTRTPTPRAWASSSSSPTPAWCRQVVRPAVVESAVRYPFRLERGLQHHRAAGLPGAQGPPGPIVGRAHHHGHHPVDFIAAGMLLAPPRCSTAPRAGLPAGLVGLQPGDLAAPDELTGLAVRRMHATGPSAARKVAQRIKTRLEGRAVTYDQFERWSSPLLKRVADG